MHSVMPRWHGLSGVQSPPLTHERHGPPSHSGGAPSGFALSGPPSLAPLPQPPSAQNTHDASAAHSGTTLTSHAPSLPLQDPSWIGPTVFPPQLHAKALAVSAARAAPRPSVRLVISLPWLLWARRIKITAWGPSKPLCGRLGLLGSGPPGGRRRRMSCSPRCDRGASWEAQRGTQSSMTHRFGGVQSTSDRHGNAHFP